MTGDPQVPLTNHHFQWRRGWNLQNKFFVGGFNPCENISQLECLLPLYGRKKYVPAANWLPAANPTGRLTIATVKNRHETWPSCTPSLGLKHTTNGICLTNDPNKKTRKNVAFGSNNPICEPKSCFTRQNCAQPCSQIHTATKSENKINPIRDGQRTAPEQLFDIVWSYAFAGSAKKTMIPHFVSFIPAWLPVPLYKTSNTLTGTSGWWCNVFLLLQALCASGPNQIRKINECKITDKKLSP